MIPAISWYDVAAAFRSTFRRMRCMADCFLLARNEMHARLVCRVLQSLCFKVMGTRAFYL